MGADAEVTKGVGGRGFAGLGGRGVKGLLRMLLLSGNLVCTYCLSLLSSEAYAGSFVRTMASVMLMSLFMRFGMHKIIIKNAAVVREDPGIGFLIFVEAIYSAFFLSLFVGASMLFFNWIVNADHSGILVLCSAFLFSSSVFAAYLMRCLDLPVRSAFFETGGIYYVMLLLFAAASFRGAEVSVDLVVFGASLFLSIASLATLKICIPGEFSFARFTGSQSLRNVRDGRVPFRNIRGSVGAFVSEVNSVGPSQIILILAGSLVDDALLFKIRIIERLVAFSLLSQSLTATFRMADLSRQISAQGMSRETFSMLNRFGRKNAKFAIVSLIPTWFAVQLFVDSSFPVRATTFAILAGGCLVSARLGPVGNAQIFAFSATRLSLIGLFSFSVTLLAIFLAFQTANWYGLPLALAGCMIVRNGVCYASLRACAKDR